MAELRAVMFFVGKLFCLWGVVILLCASPASGEVTTLTRISEIRSLSHKAAGERLPVRLQVVVAVRTHSGCYVSDGEHCVWAMKQKIDSRAEPGAILEIEGTTASFGYTPEIIINKWRVVGQGAVPMARRVSAERLISGAEDCEMIEIEGVVQQAILPVEPHQPILVVAVDGQLCRVKIMNSDMDPRQFVDARVRIRGIFQSRLNLRGQAIGMEMHISEKGGIEVVTPAPPFFSSPPIPLRELSMLSPDDRIGHRCVVRGVVTFTSPGQFFFMQEGDTAVRVESHDAVEVGDEVEVAGFVSFARSLAGLSGATVKKVGRQTVAAPLDTSVAKILRPHLQNPSAGVATSDQSGLVVRLRGRLLQVSTDQESATTSLMIESDGQVFPAFIPFAQAMSMRWVVGSDLELVGICELDFRENMQAFESATHPITGFHLWLSSLSDVRVIHTPSWWTPQRLSIGLGATLAVLLASILWSVSLRREVIRRSTQLAREISARHEAALEFDAVLRERTRLAHDLHDNLEQTLTGLSLQLQAVALFRSDEPSRSVRHLQLAQQFLDRSREDLHRTVWDLRILGLDGKSLEDALRERVKGLVADGAVRIEVTAVGQPFAMPDFVAGNLLLLAQEAISNSLKHASASLIEVCVGYDEEGVTLSVTDDGAGFEKENVPGHREGHFGLQGMLERVKRLGGSLTITSSPGQGTRIEARVATAAFDARLGV